MADVPVQREKITVIGNYSYDKPFFIDSDLNLTIGGDTEQYQAQRSSRAKTTQTVNIPSPTRAEFWLRSRGESPVTFTLSSPSGDSYNGNGVPDGAAYHEFVEYVSNGTTNISIVPAATTWQNLSLSVDGQVISDSFQTAAYLSALTVGEHAVKVTDGGTTLLEQTVSLSDSTDYSLYLYDDGGTMKGMFKTNDSIPTIDNGLIRMLNLRAGSPSIDVTLSREDGSEIPLVTSLAYQQSSDLIETIASTNYYTPDLNTLDSQELLTVTVKEAGSDNLVATTFVYLSPGSQVALYLLDYQGNGFVVDTVDRTMKRQTTVGYVIDTAETGTWSLYLDQLTNDYDLDIQVTKPKPQFSNVKIVDQTLQWELTSGQANTAVDVYYQTEPTTGDTYIGQTVTGTIASALDGSQQSYALDVNLLPSGTYYVYLVANDGINETIKAGASETLVVAHTWPESWTANLSLTQTDYRQVTATWDRFPNPDFDEYLLVWQTKGSTDTNSLPLDSTTFNRELIINNLNAGVTYQMWVVGRNLQTQQSSKSELAEILVKGAEFELIGPIDMPTIQVGQPVTMSIEVKSNLEPYPEPIKLSEALDIPTGLDITFIPDSIIPTKDGVEVQAVIQAGELLPNGMLETLITGFGGGTEFSLPFNPNIIAPVFTIGASTDPILVTDLQPGSLVLTPNRQNGHDRIINISVISASQLSATISDDALADGETATITLTDFGMDEPGSYSLILRLDDGVHTVDISRTITINRPSFNLYPTSLDSLTETLHLQSTPGFDNVFRVPLAITIDGWGQPINLILNDSTPIPHGRFGLVTQSGARTGLTFQHLVGLELDTLPDDQLTNWLIFNQAGEAELYIEVSADTPAGDYLIPMLAESDGEELPVEVLLEVSHAILTTGPPDNINDVYLPVLMK
ncbi:fibronectin type III domain-containing protein, partial [Anaerolineales bacterium HSG24]|nr:fibronectin type III domain-containing protein [Anaerolineales bacterium HSG24]